MMKSVLENIWIILTAGVLIGSTIVIIFKLKTVSSVVNSVINDTLKRDGKWSKTALTMFTAWVTVIWSYHYHVMKDGFDQTSFGIMVGVALGAKVTDAVSKKLNPDIPKL